MTTPSSRRRPGGPSGAKLLISATALAATLTGWAALTWRQAAAAAASSTALGSAESQLAASGVNLQPLPTLVPNSGSSPSAPARKSQPVLRNVSAPPAPVVMTQSSRP